MCDQELIKVKWPYQSTFCAAFQSTHLLLKYNIDEIDSFQSDKKEGNNFMSVFGKALETPNDNDKSLAYPYCWLTLIKSIFINIDKILKVSKKCLAFFANT